MIPSEARGAWHDLEARLRPYVTRRVPSAADVDDVLQEVFVRVHRGLPNLADGERFGAWVYRIASNAVADQLRDRMRHRPAAPETGAEPNAPEPDMDLETELAECIALFVARLPSPYREAVTLTELQGLTQKDAAEMLDVSLSGMKSRVQRGRERIRRMFEECCEISLDCRGRVTDCTPRNLDQVPEDCQDAARAWATRER